MITTKELINEAISLPIDGKAKFIDSILMSMYSSKIDIQIKWLKLAKKRLEEIKSGKVKAIPLEEVSCNLMNNLSLL
ncbi:MAG: addiction module protein [Lentisphaerota bacterium]